MRQATNRVLFFGLLSILALAWLGGLILNAMPCVLPVLSLKLLGFIEAAGSSRSHVRMSGLATGAGILLSFWLLAAIGVIMKSAGQLVGWGIQFQNPSFVAILTLIVVFFCLNLSGPQRQLYWNLVTLCPT